MSNKVTWESFKEYNREAWLEFYIKWNYAPWYEHVAQITWLAILVSLFYYGAHGVIFLLHYASDIGVDPNGIVGVLLTFAIFLPVIAIFLAHWLYGKLIRFLFSFAGVKTND